MALGIPTFVGNDVETMRNAARANLALFTTFLIYQRMFRETDSPKRWRMRSRAPAAIRTAIAKPGASRNERLTYLALVLIGEAGEACDNIKNLIRHSKLDEDYFVYELGDLIYYWTCLCAELRQAPSDMLARSRANIEERFAERAAGITLRNG
jgi:hypothetical protein